ncbi:MAG: glycosyltransferase [Planctomycetota bacterium]|nr:glycosyltransferase [Planctomycetota bacterium]
MTVGLLSPPPIHCDIATTPLYRATIIVSVYQDASALRLIFESLRRQSVGGFQVIIAEDGDSSEIQAVLAAARPELGSLVQLTQEDGGFRKSHAVNRAASRVKSPYLIFLGVSERLNYENNVSHQ